MKPSFIGLSLVCSLMSLTACTARGTPDASVALRALDQQLLDAVAVGGVDIWQRSLAEGAVYVDENGAIIGRAEFLKQLRPLPAGVSGRIRIVDHKVQVSANMATVIHRDEEEEHYHGQILHAEYLTTETWQNTNGRWQLLLVHVFAVPHVPMPTSLSELELQSYEGRYVAGEGLTYSVTLNEGHLEGGRAGRPPSRLDAELRDVFFIQDQPRNRKIFQRDSSGKVSGFVDRREGQDLLWKKQ
jgi:Domain of unknown function (DUF4440)